MHSSDIEVDLKPSSRTKSGRDRRNPLAACGASGLGQYRSADIASARPYDVRRTCRDRAEDLRRRPGYAARNRRRPFERRLAAIPGLVDLQVEKQVLIPQLEIRVDYGRAALYGVQPAVVVEQLSRLSNGRVVSRVVDGYRRFDVTMRLPDRLRTTQKLGDLLIETPSGLDPGAAARRHRGNRRSEPDPARERPPPRGGAGQHRAAAPTWRRSSKRSGRRAGVDKAARRLFYAPGRHVSGAGRGEPNHRDSLAALPVADLRHSLQPLSLGRCWP